MRLAPTLVGDLSYYSAAIAFSSCDMLMRKRWKAPQLRNVFAAESVQLTVNAGNAVDAGVSMCDCHYTYIQKRGKNNTRRLQGQAAPVKIEKQWMKSID